MCFKKISRQSLIWFERRKKKAMIFLCVQKIQDRFGRLLWAKMKLDGYLVGLKSFTVWPGSKQVTGTSLWYHRSHLSWGVTLCGDTAPKTFQHLTFQRLLKTLDTFGHCQRPVFSLGVSQHMRKITNLWNFELNRSSKLRDNNERKSTYVTRSCVLSEAWFRDLKF